jgi:hypothetical protein
MRHGPEPNILDTGIDPGPNLLRVCAIGIYRRPRHGQKPNLLDTGMDRQPNLLRGTRAPSTKRVNFSDDHQGMDQGPNFLDTGIDPRPNLL